MSGLAEDLATREKESLRRRPSVRQPVVVASLLVEDQVVDAVAEFRREREQGAFTGLDDGAVMACGRYGVHCAFRVVGVD